MPCSRRRPRAVAARQDVQQIEHAELLGAGHPADELRGDVLIFAFGLLRDRGFQHGTVGVQRRGLPLAQHEVARLGLHAAAGHTATRPWNTWTRLCPSAVTSTPNSVPRSVTTAVGVRTDKEGIRD